MPWQRRSRRTLVDSKFVKVYEDSVTLHGGQEIDDYTVVTFASPVVVVATNNDDNILVLREYRYAHNEVMLTFPAGMIDEGETPIDAAKRELHEETGFKAEILEYLGELYEYPTKLTHSTHVVLAKGIYRDAEPHYELTEQVESIRLLPVSEIRHMIKDNELKTAVIIAAFNLAFL